jgi:hypothetical protein
MENSLKEKSSKIPKAVPFILINILLERYSTTGTGGKKIDSDYANKEQ